MDARDEAARRRTATVTETARMCEGLSLEENLRFFARMREVPEAELGERIDGLLERLDLGSKRAARLGELSTGMRKRAQLARALAHAPDLLFLDEPTSGLDPASAREAVTFIRELVLGKLLGAFIPSMAMSLGSFALYFGVTNGLFLAPAASLLGLGCSRVSSIKAKSYIEAQQASAIAIAIAILPCMLFIAAQIGGIVVVGPVAVIAAALILGAIDWAVIAKVAPRFERERIIGCL